MIMTRILTGFVLCSTCLMLFLAMSNAAHPPQGEELVFWNLQVLQTGSDGFHYEFRDINGTEFWAHFCRDYEPQFDAGMTLVILKVQDFGQCWSVRDTHPAYLIKRDMKGNIIREDFNARHRKEASTTP